MAGEEGGQPSLEERVAALEKTVALLEQRLQARASDAGVARPSLATLPRRPVEAPPPPRPTLPIVPSDPGQWVNRLGIALVLLGAALGFKYSIDRGWIGPAMRVVFGLGLGAALLALSSLLRGARPGLSRVLAGGGIASGYLAIFAAFQLYHLVSFASAIAAMSAITAVGFVFALRDDDAMTGTIATLGGLATPFLLYAGGRNLVGLVAYTCLVVAGSGAVYARSGWRVLMWTTAAGAWLVLASAASQAGAGGGMGAAAVEGGIVFVALATWWLAVVREMLSVENPVTWRPARFGIADGLAGSLVPDGPDWMLQPHQLALATPVLVLALSSWTWNLQGTATGWVAASLAVGWAGAAFHLRSIDGSVAQRLSVTHALGAAVMLASSMSFLLGDEARRVGLAAEALALVALAARSRDRRSAILGHLLFAAISLETFARMQHDASASLASFGRVEWSELAVVALLAAATRAASRQARDAYFAAAQAGLLMWLLRALDPRPNGAAMVTAAWFTDAVLLVVAGLRSGSRTVRTAGAAVMALTMGKLFVFDLSEVDAGWRIVVFLAFGAVLLALGYAFPSLWRDEGSSGRPGA